MDESEGSGVIVEVAWILICGAVGALATWYGYRSGYEHGRRSVPTTQAYDLGRKAGQRETAAFLASSEIPAVRAVGLALQADRWGR